MPKKRNPTEHTEDRSGSAAGPGSQDLPEGAEHAEYTGYDREDTGHSKGDPGEAEARREASLQPGGEVDTEREKKLDDEARSNEARPEDARPGDSRPEDTRSEDARSS